MCAAMILSLGLQEILFQSALDTEKLPDKFQIVNWRNEIDQNMRILEKTSQFGKNHFDQASLAIYGLYGN